MLSVSARMLTGTRALLSHLAMKQEPSALINSNEDDKVPHVLKLKVREIFNGKYMCTYNMMLRS